MSKLYTSILNSARETNNNHLNYCHQPNIGYCPVDGSDSENAQTIPLPDDAPSVLGCPYYHRREDIPSPTYKCYGDQIKDYIGTDSFVCHPEPTPPIVINLLVL